MLFIGAVTIVVKERVTVQSTFCDSHIRQRYTGKMQKGYTGQEPMVAQVDK
jgi:hypothetical protein